MWEVSPDRYSKTSQRLEIRNATHLKKNPRAVHWNTHQISPPAIMNEEEKTWYRHFLRVHSR